MSNRDLSGLPNILFIMTDQHRWDCAGGDNGWFETPKIASIAAGGVRFANCITNSPECVPARVSLGTGLYPHQTGVSQNTAYYLLPTAPSWMKSIHSSGYRMSVFGKTHLHRHRGDLRDREFILRAHGFEVIDEIGGPRASRHLMSNMTDRWRRADVRDTYAADMAARLETANIADTSPSPLPFSLYPDVYVGQKASQYLKTYSDHAPWFCWVSFGGPHEPWDAPERYAKKYRPCDMPRPRKIFRDHGDRPSSVLDSHPSLQYPLEESDFLRIRASYAGNIALIDDQIGEILKIIEERGELSNTAIVFTSDHGEMAGDAGFLYKGHFLDGAVRVPLIVRLPEGRTERKEAAQCDAMTELMDVGPLLADIAGASLDFPQNGLSILDLVEETATLHRDFAMAEFKGETMYLDRDWKMAINASGEPYLLFDLNNDPLESENLINEPARKKLMRDLSARLLGRVKQGMHRIPLV